MFRPYESKRAFEDVAEQIHQAILSGRLKVGERLPPERSLAEQFQAGRLTIREALRTLETRGFIKVRKGSSGGAYVEVGNPQNVASIIIDNLTIEGLTGFQITEARTALECAIVRVATKRGNRPDILQIGEELEDSKKTSSQDDPQTVLSRMIRFHLLLAESTHNPTFILFIRTLMEWARRKLLHYVPSSKHVEYSYKAHKGIFEAVKKKDADLAEHLMKKHVEQMRIIVSGSERPPA